MPDQPWETTFNFVMVTLVFGTLLIVMWVAAINKGGDWWMWLLLVVLTFQSLSFAVPRIMNWLRHAR